MLVQQFIDNLLRTPNKVRPMQTGVLLIVISGKLDHPSPAAPKLFEIMHMIWIEFIDRFLGRFFNVQITGNTCFEL